MYRVKQSAFTRYAPAYKGLIIMKARRKFNPTHQMVYSIQLQGERIFVDDDDPALVYGGPWVANRGLETDMHALSVPGGVRTPFYGTLHTASGDPFTTHQYTLHYMFNGEPYVFEY